MRVCTTVHIRDALSIAEPRPRYSRVQLDQGYSASFSSFGDSFWLGNGTAMRIGYCWQALTGVLGLDVPRASNLTKAMPERATALIAWPPSVTRMEGNAKNALV